MDNKEKMDNNNKDDGEGKALTQQMGEIIKPVVGDGTVEDILLRIYGLKVDSIKPLNSYDDCNYAITVKPEFNNNNIKQLWPHGYLMKIINTMDSKRPEMHEAQNKLMNYLKENGVPTQEHVPDKNGDLMSLQKIYSDKNQTGNHAMHLIRLMTFLPGRVLLDYPFTPKLLYQDGVFMAKINTAFQNFEHEYFKSFNTKWSLGQLCVLKDYVFVLKPEDKKVVNEVIEQFEKTVIPLVPTLPKGYIHGDLNELNLLVKPVDGQENIPMEKKDCEFTGLIDFQDTMYSCQIYDLAINIAYLTLFTTTIDQMDGPGHILAGYTSLNHLSSDEFQCLKTLIAARFCQSLVYGAYEYYTDPSNTYVLHTAKTGWPLLHRLWSEPKEKLENRWQAIMDEYKNQK